MKRALSALLGTCLFAWGACTAPAPEATQTPRRPNFVLLMADDQGWGELSARGHPWLNTPNLDAMAAGGLVLERFYAAAPVCSPTRASVLSGRHPNRFDCLAWGHDLPGDEQTLAELLSREGYATGHFGKWHVGSVRAGAATSPGAQGFDEWLSSPNFFDLDPLMSRRGEVIETQGEGSAVIVDAALNFIATAQAADRPFLAVVWFGSPHVPHRARGLLDLDDVPAEARAYCAEIHGIDRSVGKLRRELRRRGLADSTLLWYTSDNGPRPPREPEAAPRASTGGLRGDKGTLWEGGLRVPTILEWPGMLALGQVSTSVAGSVDMLPTLLELSGASLAVQRTLDGESLAPLLRGESWTRGAPLGFWTRPAIGRAMHSDKMLRAQRAGAPDPSGPLPEQPHDDSPLGRMRGTAAWVDGDWKLLRFQQESEVRSELYDLSVDPAEQDDLSGAQPARSAQLTRALEAWMRAVEHDR